MNHQPYPPRPSPGSHRRASPTTSHGPFPVRAAFDTVPPLPHPDRAGKSRTVNGKDNRHRAALIIVTVFDSSKGGKSSAPYQLWTVYSSAHRRERDYRILHVCAPSVRRRGNYFAQVRGGLHRQSISCCKYCAQPHNTVAYDLHGLPAGAPAGCGRVTDRAALPAFATIRPSCHARPRLFAPTAWLHWLQHNCYAPVQTRVSSRAACS